MINRQRHKKSCGPIAVLNALRWLGYHDTYDEIIDWSKENMDFSLKIGTPLRGLQRGLFNLGIKNELVYKITLPQLTEELDKGKAALLQFSASENHSHTSFVDAHTDKYIRAWNTLTYRKTPWLTKRILNRFIKFTNKQKFKTHAWIISKD